MESERLYRYVFYSGGIWNFIASVPTMFLVNALPGFIGIDPPNHVIFIYFNLMTMFLFGCIQFIVARHLAESRPFIKILVWSKFLTVAVFLGALAFLPMAPGLTEFLIPGMILDLVFGLLFLRYLFFSAKSLEFGPPASA
ncbi:MAG: hypothetical protein WEB33_11490 [Bacteroidota bacterium]